MKTAIAIAIACLSIPCISLAAATDTIGWSSLRTLDLGTPNPRLSDSAKEHWFDSQWRRAMGKPGAHAFNGYATIAKIEEKNSKWEITAEKARTPDQELEHQANVIRYNGGPKVHYPATFVKWTEDTRPDLSTGTNKVISGTLIGGTWTTSSITALLKDVTTDDLHDK